MKEKLLNNGHLITILFFIKLIFFYFKVELNTKMILALIISMVIFLSLHTMLLVQNNKLSKFMFIGFYVLCCFTLFSDINYFNYYNEYISINQITQTGNLIDMGSSMLKNIFTSATLVFVDIPLIIYLVFVKLDTECKYTWFSNKKNYKNFQIVFWLLLFIVALNPLKTSAFKVVNNTEIITYHIKDVSNNTIGRLLYKKKNLNTVLNKESISEVVKKEVFQDLLNSNLNTISTSSDNKYAGIGEGKNLIVIQMESAQNVLLGKKYNGQEITPNLNKLMKKDTLYFNHYYQNIGKGNTSDAELSSLNSLYPVKENSSYILYSQNHYNGLPWLLRNKGYEAISVHGYHSSFWNRSVAHNSQGFETFYSIEELDDIETLSIGLSDKEMFKQTIPILKSLKKPYFSFIITLTNHYPYEMEESAATLKLKEEHTATYFGNYLQSSHYADEAIGKFIQDLKEKGLYDDTIIVLYGDHHGLNSQTEENYQLMTEFLGYDYDYDSMMNVPLMIHLPNSGISETIDTVGGQVDLLPTLAYIMNIDLSDNVILGQNILRAKKGFVAFSSYIPEGSFISGDILYSMSRDGKFENGTAKNIHTREQVPINDLYPSYEKSIALLRISKYILEHDGILINSPIYDEVNKNSNSTK